MSIYDQIAAAAAQKDRYVNTAGMARPVAAGPRPRFQPTRSNPAPSISVPGVGRSGGRSKALADFRSGATAPKESDGGFNPLGAIGRGVAAGFGGVLNAADASRRVAQGYMGEVGDLMSNLPDPVEKLANTALLNPFQFRSLEDEDGNRDQSFDFSEIGDRVTGDNQMMEGSLGHATWDDDLPGFMRPALGFALDILTDPATYVTAGTVGTASKVAGTAGRVALAQKIGEQALTEAGKKVAPKVAKSLAREAGMRGSGALTEKGIKRAGATVDDLVNLGLKPDWGLSVGVGSKRAGIKGTARPAQSIANVKGNIKKYTGSTRAGRLSRELFTSAEYGESALKQKVLSGAVDSADAARMLAVIGRSKGESWAWFDDASRRLNHASDDGSKLAGLSDNEAATLTHAMERGDFDHPLVRQLTEVFETFGRELQDAGAQFNMRQGYVPHRLSKKAISNLESGNLEIKALLDDTIERPEAFQKLRQSDQTIDSINAEWRKNHDYDLLETDFRTLSTQYLGEGQQAMMKAHLVGKMAEDRGLVAPMTKAVDAEQVRKALDAETAKEASLLSKSVANRRQAITKAIRVARARSAETSLAVTKAKSALTKAETKVGTAKSRAVKLEADMMAGRQALALNEGLAKVARGKEKAELTRKITALQADLDGAAKELQGAQRQLANAENNFGRLADDVRKAEAEYDIHETNFSKMMDDRDALDNAPVAREAVQAQEAADNAAVKAQESAEKFANAQSDVAAAETTAQFLSSDVSKVVDRLDAEIAEFDDWTARVKATRKAGKPTLDSNMALRDEQRELLSDIRDVLRASDDPQVQQIAKLEAQAIIADTKALMGSAKGKEPLMGRMARKRMETEFEAGIDLLENPRFQDYIIGQLDEGMSRLKSNLDGVPDRQIDEQYRRAIETHRKFTDPSTRGPTFRALAKVVRLHGRAMNWWKGWALASPGFVFRNIYSGVFAQYLDDAANPVISARFYRYLKRVEKDPDAAKAWAFGKYGEDGARQLDDAHKVASASGWGQTTGEVERSLTNKTGWINPLSANWAPVKGMRKAASESEAYLRGGHAYNVLQRGGSFEDALSRVEKFHFNYRDLSEFDRNAKKVMPFYTFWSRNMGLQMSVFAKKPQKITRSFYNAKRNIEESADPDTGELPFYFQNDMAGILSPFGSDTSDKGRMYLTPDLPSARFPSQMAGMVDNPMGEIMQMTGPAIQTPAQLALNKNFFLDRDYRNSLETYTDDGPAVRRAPGIMQAPGVRNVLGMLPGAENTDAGLLMQDNVQDAVMNVSPLLSRVSRLPGVSQTDRQQQTNRQFWWNFVGAPVRWNDEGSQAGAAAEQRRHADELADKVWDRIRLEKLISEAEGGR